MPIVSASRSAARAGSGGHQQQPPRQPTARAGAAGARARAIRGKRSLAPAKTRQLLERRVNPVILSAAGEVGYVTPRVACSRERSNQLRCFRPEARKGRPRVSEPLQRIVQLPNCHTEDRGMKHLLNGVAIAAALAIAAPAWAQAPMTPGAPKARRAPRRRRLPRPQRRSEGVQAAASPDAPCGQGRQERKMRAGGGDSMTEQLNREELARIQAAACRAPMGGRCRRADEAGAGQGGRAAERALSASRPAAPHTELSQGGRTAPLSHRRKYPSSTCSRGRVSRGSTSRSARACRRRCGTRRTRQSRVR